MNTKNVNKQSVEFSKWVICFFISIYFAQDLVPFTTITDALSGEIISWEIVLFIPFFSYKFGNYFRIKSVPESLFFCLLILFIIYYIVPMSFIESSSFFCMLLGSFYFLFKFII